MFKYLIKQEYKAFNASDFALDPTFIDWVKGDSEEHNKFWSEWLKNNPEKEEEIELARSLVLALQFRQEKITSKEVNAEWQKLLANAANFRHYPLDTDKNLSPTLYRGMARIAAVLLLIFASAFVFYWLAVRPDRLQGNQLTVVKETPKGQKLSIVLSDGSEIKLNSDSRITYPARFTGDSREVVLEGEAFFDVVHDEKMPFKVRTDNVTVEVLGTSFNVNAYPESTDIKIALVEGRVKVNTQDSARGNQDFLLKPNEMIEIDKRDASYRVQNFDPREITGWKDGYLYFEKVDFSKTILKLERWYGVKFEIAHHAAIDSNWRFNGKFQNKSLEYILRTFSYPDLFRYKIEEQKVIIY